MKNWKYTLILLLALVFTACQEDEPATMEAKVDIQDLTVNASYREADIRCKISTNATIQELVLEYSMLDTAFTNPQQAKMTKVNPKSDEPIYEVHIAPLAENMVYYMRARVVNKFTSCTSERKSFNTLAYELATIHTDSVTDVSISSAKLHGTLLKSGTDSVPQIGFYYAKHPDVKATDSCVLFPLLVNVDTVSYSLSIDNLEDNATYYFRAFAKNCKGIAFGDEMQLTTQEVFMPTVSGVTVSNITYTTAVVSGSVLADGGAPVTERGIVYSTSAELATDGTKVSSFSGADEFSCSLVGLTADTKYYVCVFATNAKGTTYGQPKSFRTNAYGVPTVTTGQVTDITHNSAKVKGDVSSDGGQTVTERGICYSKNPNPTILYSYKVTSSGTTGGFTCALTGLDDGTTYYARAYAINSKGVAYGDDVTFETKAYSVPTVTTATVTNISYETATAGGNVTSDGDLTVTERGVCYSTSPTPTTEDTKVTSTGTVGAFTCALTALTPGTTYYVRAYAINSRGTGYGDAVSFNTPDYGAPVVSTSEVTNISYETATAGGNVTSDGDQTVTERGICYATSQNPTTESTKIQSGSGMGEFTCNLTGLTNNTKYYVRAYAINSKGTSYGVEVSFTTKEFSKPVVVTEKVDGITAVSATAYGKVTADGGQDVTERGICFALTANPTVSDTKVASGLGIGQFTCNLTGLTEGTTYHVRAYATNSKGTSYGEDLTFVTTAYLIPTVTTSSITEITFTTAKAGGNVTSDGGQEVTEKGVCYATTAEPTIYNTKVVSDLVGTGAYTCQLTDLVPNTTYHIRAYATNSKGTAYGTDRTFTTNSYAVPVVASVAATNVSYTSATCGGNITSDGGTDITQCGICYSSWKTNPTISDDKVVGTYSGLGEFSCNLTGLINGREYHFRAYAMNSEGVAYGDILTFTTTKYPAPTVTTYDPENVSYMTATCKGYVSIDAELSITERGFCYSKTQTNPDLDYDHVLAGTGKGEFTYDFTGLEPNTTYYVRAYAKTTYETGYGEVKVFTTKEYKLPEVTTKSADYISFYAAICYGNVTNDNGETVIERGICYSTEHNPTVAGLRVSSGSGTGSFQCGLVDLTDNTTYYYRAYATSSLGTGYGAEKSFTTVDVTAATIYYTANHKLAESYSDPYGDEGYVHLDAFGSALDSHTFEDGVGTLRFTDKVTKISSYAFSGCKALITVTLPYSVTTIEYQAFDGCSGLISFDIPENVNSMSPGYVFNVFEGCSSLTAFHVAENNQYFCDVDGVLFNKDKTIIYQYPDGKSGDSYSIPSSVTEISDNVFKDCVQLTSVYIPEGVLKIDWGAFRECKGLTDVTIPNSVTYIGTYAFENCTNLTTLVLGTGLTGIDSYAFHYCSSLESITSKAITPPSLYSNWGAPFANVDKSTPVYVPGAFINAYKNADGWKSFTNILAIP